MEISGFPPVSEEKYENCEIRIEISFVLGNDWRAHWQKRQKYTKYSNPVAL